MSLFKRCLEIDPKHYKALFNLGVIWYKLGYESKAQDSYSQSIHQNPNYPYSYLNLAVIHKEAGDYEKAVEILGKGIAYNVEASFLYYNRACFLVQLNRLSEALEDLKPAVRLSPELFEYMEKDDELKPVRAREDYRKTFGIY